MFFLAHGRQFVFQLQFSVLHSAAIEEGADRLAAFGNPVGQLPGLGPVFFYVAETVGDLMRVKETPCFTAGPSFGVTDKEIHKPAHFPYKVAGPSIN